MLHEVLAELQCTGRQTLLSHASEHIPSTNLVADSVAKHDVPRDAQQAIYAGRDRERPVDHLVELGRVDHVPRQRRDHRMARELQCNVPNEDPRSAQLPRLCHVLHMQAQERKHAPQP